MSHEADAKPLFLQEAERRAAREGRTVEDVLAGDRERLRSNRYPGPGCLDPEDVQGLLVGTVPEGRQEELLGHVEGCDHCAALLMLSEPPPSTLDAVLRAVRARPPQSAVAAAAAPEPDEQEGRSGQVALDVAATVAPSLLVLGWVAAGRSGRLEARPLLTLLAVSAVLGLAAWWVSRLPVVRGSLLQYSVGAVAGGVSLALAWQILSNASAHQIASAETAAFALAKDTAKEQVFDLLETRQATHRFPSMASVKRPLAMHVRSVTDGKAVYVASENWFSGELVAEITPVSAELHLKKDKEPDQLLSRFVVGKVTALDKTTLAVNSSGTTYTLSMGGSVAPAEGSDVIAATDAGGKTVVSFRQLPASAHPEDRAHAQDSSR